MYLVKLAKDWQGNVVKDEAGLADYFFDGSYRDYDVFKIIADEGIFIKLEDDEVSEIIGESGYDGFQESLDIEAHREAK